MSFTASLVAAALTLSAAAPGKFDWPEWRGPNRDGICKETGLLKEWPKSGPRVVWTAKDLGVGFGAPSVVDGMVYGIGNKDGKDGVWALKEADGKQVWFTPFADGVNVAKQTNGPASTPTYADGKLYTVSLGGTLSCLNAKDGKLVWKKSYVSDFGGKVPTWGFGESVLVDGDKVIGAPGGAEAAIVAFNAKTGATIWKSAVGPVGGGNGYSSPVKATIGGKDMYIVLLGDKAGIVGVDVANGKLLWSYNKKPAAGGVAQIPTPIVRGDKVWVSCSYSGGAALLQLTPAGGKFDVKEVKAYTKPELNNHHGGMVLVGDYIYFGHDQNQGYPVCVHFDTGEIKWGPEKNLREVGVSGSAAITYADGRLYFRYQSGSLVLIDPSPDALKVVSSFKLPEANVRTHPQSWPHPVIANGKLYVRDQNVMYAYDVKASSN